MTGKTTIKKELFTAINNRILLCDGAMGTSLQSLGYKDVNDLLNLDARALEDISGIHLKYIEAGSDIIQTNTIGANPLKLEKQGDLSHFKDVNKNGLKAAGDAIALYREKTGNDRKIFIAGNIGPTGQILEPYGSLSISSAIDSYSRQVESLLENGADFLLIETMIDLNEAIAAVKAARSVTAEAVVACTMSFLANGVTVMGDKAEECGDKLINAGCDIIGANCSVGSDIMAQITAKIRKANPEAKLLIQPNAGLPMVKDGKTFFNETAAVMAENFRNILRYNPSIIGACCGSTPEHIEKLYYLIHER